MKTLLFAAIAVAIAAPAYAQASDTLKAVVAHGIVLDAGGARIDVSYTPDGRFTAMEGQITGRWRIDGEKLCTATEATPEDCVRYPTGKKSGDSFEVTGAMGTGTITIK